jgi:hypothetical protein
MGLATVVALAAVNSGCVVAMGNKGSAKGYAQRQAVALEGNIYVVDVRTGDVKRIDRSRIDGAGQFVSGEQVTVEVEVDD